MERQKVYIEICYDCADFTTARIAIVSVDEREGWTYTVDYFEEAKKKLFSYLFKEHGINENEVLIHDWKYHGFVLDILK